MSFLRRLLRRQDGITLVMAVGILGVLTISGTTLIYYSSTNARSVSYSAANGSAYDLAESGINEMMAVLSKPDNNALNKYLLGEQTNGSVTHTTHTYDGGTVEWWGTLSQSVTGASTWSLTSIGKVKNPTGDNGERRDADTHGEGARRPTYTQPLNNPAWNFIYSRGTGQTCDMTIQQSVVVQSPLYVAGNLCLTNTASITAGPLVVQGSFTMSQSANFAGTSSTPLNQLNVRNGCKWKNNALHNPCQQGAGSSGFDNVWATLIGEQPGPATRPRRWTGTPGT